MRRAHRTDGNQREIVDGLRKAGFWVHVLSDVGRGFPDVVVGAYGRWVLLEIKRPGPPSARKLTEPENAFHAAARARRLPCAVVQTLQEALAAVAEARELFAA